MAIVESAEPGKSLGVFTSVFEEYADWPEDLKCPGCGCKLEGYEVFACRLRGLKRPVCLGCLINALLYLRDHVYPLMQGLEQLVLDLAEKVGDESERLDAAQGK